MSFQVRARRLQALLALCVAAGMLSATGCGAAPTRSTTTSRALPGAPPPLPATEPYLAMTAGASGWAVWPSGGSWVLLQTSDGFAHVNNRTPAAVPTDGGLIGSFSADQVAVGVGAHERLLRSPVLTRVVAGWTPIELPGAVSPARHALSLLGGRLTAVTSDGALRERAGSGWVTLTRASVLVVNGGLQLDAVTWATSSLGWVTGHGLAGRPMAFQTNDGGAHWLAVEGTRGNAVAALAPCGSAASWLLPVISDDGQVRLLRSSDAGLTWKAGRSIAATTGEPAWTCVGDAVLMAGGSGSRDHVFASPDGGQHWTDRGLAPAELTDLALTGGGDGYAASGGKHPTLWSVSDDGARFTRLSLPPWVATIGGSAGGT